jgi:hypothetical protein
LVHFHVDELIPNCPALQGAGRKIGPDFGTLVSTALLPDLNEIEGSLASAKCGTKGYAEFPPLVWGLTSNM